MLSELLAGTCEISWLQESWNLHCSFRNLLIMNEGSWTLRADTFKGCGPFRKFYRGLNEALVGAVSHLVCQLLRYWASSFGCFCGSGIPFDGVLTRRALLFGVYVWGPDFWQLRFQGSHATTSCSQVSSVSSFSIALATVM